MERPLVVVELAANERLAQDLAAGGVFVPGCKLGHDVDCDLVVRGARGEVTVAARVVWVDGERGAGLQLIGCDTETKRRIAELAEPEAETAPETDDGDEVVRRAPPTLHERLRGLSLVEQVKVASGGEMQERVLLERMYGKNVWEALLRNPRLTSPEVARISRMGALPRMLLELIVSNGAWLQVPEVRRALLANPRLGTDQILRVLRLLPRPELKLAGLQTAYPIAVRDAAKRMFKDGS